MIKSVIWSSMLDYPGHICTSIFFERCNFKCEFCHNKEISKKDNINFKKDVLPKLIERKDFIEYIILSGGECTIAENIQEIVDTLYNNEFKIGIHTNGYNLEFIKNNVSKISYIAMDIKNDLENYDEICGTQINIEKIKQSIKYIIDSGIAYEFRTTVYPKYIDMKNCIQIAKYLKSMGANKYILQQYKEVEGIEETPYKEEKLITIRNECNEYIHTYLRGI